MSASNRVVSEQAWRNLGLDLVRATEAAALAAGRWMGMGGGADADESAARAMLGVLNTLPIDGRVVIGEEGRTDTCPLPSTGQRVGTCQGPEVDLVVDPIDGRDLLARGHPGAMAVMAGAVRDGFWCPAPALYMDKIVVSSEVADALVPECMDAPAAWTLALIARVKGVPLSDLTVFVLDRPRHAHLVDEIRAAGVRVMLRTEGDIYGALLAATPGSGVDALMGIGGIPEGLIAACALKALGGAMLGRLAPQSAEERAGAEAAGLDLRRVLMTNELVAGRMVFFAATGITDGPLLSGVRYDGARARSNSLIMRGETGTRRTIVAEHLLENRLPVG